MNYAYVHCKPDGTPFYVGKGVRSRYKNFKYRNTYHKRIVAKYGQENILIGVIPCSNNENALALEIGLIKCVKRMGYTLTNLTDGGEGNVGWKCPENVTQAVAVANKKRVWTPEQRSKISKACKGKKKPQQSLRMRSLGLWVGPRNPFFGKGDQQRGATNHRARAVSGTHFEHGCRRWDTLQAVADDLKVTIQAVAQALRKKQRSKGWNLEYADGV